MTYLSKLDNVSNLFYNPFVAKRIFDILLSFFVGTVFFIPFILICIAIKLTSKGPIFHMSVRIGRDNKIFLMPKFRTMKIETPLIATHLMTNPEDYLTPVGHFLRRSSLDELPQILSVLQGKMSFVGPRPALFNQSDLKELRTQVGVHVLTPGITGWAQINGRDKIEIPQKVQLDEYYLKNRTLFFDLKILLLTAFRVFKAEDITH